MSWWLVYVLLLKASLTSFSGLGSLPMVRNDFVVERHVLSDRELNTAVAAGRTGPGPFGLYLVCVGYVADGIPGALAAGAALGAAEAARGFRQRDAHPLLVVGALVAGRTASHPRSSSRRRAHDPPPSRRPRSLTRLSTVRWNSAMSRKER